MATNWYAPTVGDLQLFLPQAVLTATDQVPDGQDTSQGRNAKMLALQIARVRGTIQKVGRQALSLTAGSVPPEAQQHVLVLAVKALPTAASAELARYMENPEFKELCDEARDWLKGVAEGKVTVMDASDPTGVDYLTAVSATNPAVSAISWGDQFADGESYAAGYKTDSGGTVIQLPEDNMVLEN
jgi:hypothetical protein